MEKRSKKMYGYWGVLVLFMAGCFASPVLTGMVREYAKRTFHGEYILYIEIFKMVLCVLFYLTLRLSESLTFKLRMTVEGLKTLYVFVICIYYLRTTLYVEQILLYTVVISLANIIYSVIVQKKNE